MALTKSVSGEVRRDKLFDNLKEWLRPEEVAELFGISVKTIYDWKYRGKLINVPQGLFRKFNHRLYIRTEVLNDWVSTQNPNG